MSLVSPGTPPIEAVGSTATVAVDEHAEPEVSVVVPIYNERENLVRLHDALSYALIALDRPYEILLVDDGSSDGGRELLRVLAGRDPNLRVIFFRRNYGQTAAIAKGFQAARGKILVTMDGDLQNDPADIASLIDKLDEGFDIVCGWRRFRQDRMTTRLLPSRVANFLIARVTGVRIHDTGCSLKVYRSWVARSLYLYSDMHRFMAALGAGLGARIAEVPVRHHARSFGQSKYGLGRIFRVLADLIVIKMLIQFSAHPIRWFSYLALPLVAVAVPLFFLGFFEKGKDGFVLAKQTDLVLLTGATVATIVAFNVFLLGFLAELQVKVSRFFKRRIAITAREAVR